MFPKQDTVPPSQHHRTFLHHLCQCFLFLHSQHHPRSTKVSSSQFPVSRTITLLPLLQYRKPPTVWYRTMFRGRDHCLPNHSKPGNGFRPLPRYLRIKPTITRSEHLLYRTHKTSYVRPPPSRDPRLSNRIRSLFPLDLLDPLDLGPIHHRTPRITSFPQARLIIIPLPHLPNPRPRNSRRLCVCLTAQHLQAGLSHPRLYHRGLDTLGQSPADQVCHCLRRRHFRRPGLINSCHFLNSLYHPHLYLAPSLSSSI
jgi:hypothetical protein